MKRLILILVFPAFASFLRAEQFSALVFADAYDQYHHRNVPAVREAFHALSKKHFFELTWVERDVEFARQTFADYDVIVFVSANPCELDEAKREEFVNYVKSGGGIVGVPNAPTLSPRSHAHLHRRRPGRPPPGSLPHRAGAAGPPRPSAADALSGVLENHGASLDCAGPGGRIKGAMERPVCAYEGDLLGNVIPRSEALALVPFSETKFKEFVASGRIRTMRVGRTAYYLRRTLEEDLRSILGVAHHGEAVQAQGPKRLDPPMDRRERA